MGWENPFFGERGWKKLEMGGSKELTLWIEEGYETTAMSELRWLQESRFDVFHSHAGHNWPLIIVLEVVFGGGPGIGITVSSVGIPMTILFIVLLRHKKIKRLNCSICGYWWDDRENGALKTETKANEDLIRKGSLSMEEEEPGDH